jgi:hypothetical protein
MIEDDISRSLDEQIKEERLRETASGTGKKARFARHTLRRKKATETDTCPEGHKYTDENTLYNAAGRRMCLHCLRDRRIYPDKASDRLTSHGREVIDTTDPNKDK